MKKLLSLLGSVGMIATTGATVVACSNNTKETPDETPKMGVKEKLQVKIDEASDLVKNSKKIWPAASVLKKYLVEAIAISLKEGATEKQLISATNKLERAIHVHNESEDESPNIIAKKELKEKIDEAEWLLANSKKNDSINKALNHQIYYARTVLLMPNAATQKLRDAKVDLQKVIDEFNATENK